MAGMALVIPPAVNFPSPLVAVPIRDWTTPPPEGRRAVPVYIDWSLHGGTAKCVTLDAGGNTYAPLSRICALAIDNSQSGADVTIVFPDTMATLAVPAGAELTAEALTNGTAMYVIAPNAIAGDATSIAIHNTLPPPFAMPRLNNQSAVAVFGAALATGTSAILAAGINGTIGNLSVIISAANPAAASAMAWRIQDGASSPNTIAVGNATFPISAYTMAPVVQLSNLNVRFTNGLNLVQSGSFSTNGTIYVNLYYRTP
jgi:hypothetical protein